MCLCPPISWRPERPPSSVTGQNPPVYHHNASFIVKSRGFRDVLAAYYFAYLLQYTVRVLRRVGARALTSKNPLAVYPFVPQVVVLSDVYVPNVFRMRDWMKRSNGGSILTTEADRDLLNSILRELRDAKSSDLSL